MGKNIDSIELVGEATRMPFVHQVISESNGFKDFGLNRTLNT